MEIRKTIACLRRELNDIERMIASIEDRMAANIQQPRNAPSPGKTRDLISRLCPPFQEPEFGLWLRQD